MSTHEDGYEWEICGLDGEVYARFTSYHEAREFYEWFNTSTEVTLHCIYSDVFTKPNIEDSDYDE